MTTSRLGERHNADHDMNAKKATKNTQDNDAHGGCSDVTCSPSYYTFRNLDGQTFQLRGDLTMEDLIRMGWTDIRLVNPETPLNPHEWRADSLPNADVEAQRK
jgi:hypothetical protein